MAGPSNRVLDADVSGPSNRVPDADVSGPSNSMVDADVSAKERAEVTKGSSVPTAPVPRPGWRRLAFGPHKGHHPPPRIEFLSVFLLKVPSIFRVISSLPFSLYQHLGTVSP